jgi:L-ascorbate metabolism protein UlaG (beta-lactamase superfamily)
MSKSQTDEAGVMNGPSNIAYKTFSALERRLRAHSLVLVPHRQDHEFFLETKKISLFGHLFVHEEMPHIQEAILRAFLSLQNQPPSYETLRVARRIQHILAFQRGRPVAERHPLFGHGGINIQALDRRLPHLMDQSLRFVSVASQQLQGPQPLVQGNRFLSHPDFSHSHARAEGFGIFFSTQWVRLVALLNRIIRATSRTISSEWSPFESYEFFPREARENPSTIYSHDAPHLENSPKFSYYFIGHATALCEVPLKNGKAIETARLLVDPIEGDINALFYPRMTQPARTMDELPLIDAILITHNHRDHFSKKALQKLVPLQPVIICPKGDDDKVKALGFLNVFSFNWFEKATLKFSKGQNFTLSITPVPAAHSSGTTLSDAGRSLFSGYVIESKALDGAIYIAGDTAQLNEESLQALYRLFPIRYSIQPGGPDEPHHLMQSTHQPTVWALFVHFRLMIQRAYKQFIDEKGRPPTFLELKAEVAPFATIFTHIDTYRLGDVHFQETNRRIARFRQALRNPQSEESLTSYERQVLHSIKQLLPEIRLRSLKGSAPLKIEELDELFGDAIHIPKIGEMLSFQGLR